LQIDTAVAIVCLTVPEPVQRVHRTTSFHHSGEQSTLQITDNLSACRIVDPVVL